MKERFLKRKVLMKQKWTVKDGKLSYEGRKMSKWPMVNPILILVCSSTNAIIICIVYMYKFSLSIISKLRQFSRLSQLNWHIVSHTSYNTGTNSLFPPTVQSSYLLHTYWYTSHTHLMWSKLRRRIQAEFCLLFSYLVPFCSYPLVTLIFISNRKVAMDLNTVKLCWICITLN